MPPQPPPPLLKNVASAAALKQNAGVAQFVSVAFALIAALAAGVLGVEGWSGFAYYGVAQAAAAAVLYAKAGGAPADYAPSALSLLAGEAAGSTALLTFVLFWTLAHNWVHLF